MALFNNCSNGLSLLYIKVTQAKIGFYKRKFSKIVLSETRRPIALTFDL